MTTEQLQRADTIIRDALADLAELAPDQIAAKLAAAGMLFCGAGARTRSCPIHHWTTSRLAAHGLIRVAATLRVGRNEVFVHKPKPTAHRLVTVQVPVPVAEFIDRYDRGDYNHLKGQT